MNKGLSKLKKGDFNSLDAKGQPDGSVIITLYKRGEKRSYKFRVKNLYQLNEEEVDIDTGKPITKGNL